MRIFKYLMDEYGAIHIPKGAKPLHFGFQGDLLALWALTPEKSNLTDQRLIVLPTGAEVPENVSFFGSAIHISGRLVFHCFQVNP